MEPDQRHIGHLIKLINDALRRQIDNDMRPRGITMSQMRVLIELHRTDTGELPFKQLERLLGVAQSTVWGLVARLEEKGLVESLGSHEDARAKLVRITDTGTRICEECYAEVLEHDRQLTEGLTAEETETLRDLLERVHASIA